MFGIELAEDDAPASTRRRPSQRGRSRGSSARAPARAGCAPRTPRGRAPRTSDHRPHAAVLEVAGDDDEQRDRRNDEEDVDQEVHDVVDEPARVRGGDAEDRGERGGERGGRRSRAAASAARRSTTCEKMSLPWSVVPKRWCHDGAWRAARMLKSFGWATEISGAISAMTIDERDHRRARCATSGCAAGARTSRERCSRRRVTRGAARGRSSGRVGSSCDIRRSRRARVEDEVEDVHEQVRHDHADGEHDEQRLRERVVVAEHRLLQRQAGARVAEDVLDEDEARRPALANSAANPFERRQDRVSRPRSASSRGRSRSPLA